MISGVISGIRYTLIFPSGLDILKKILRGGGGEGDLGTLDKFFRYT